MSKKPNALVKNGKSSKRKKKMEFLNQLSKMSPEDQDKYIQKQQDPVYAEQLIRELTARKKDIDVIIRGLQKIEDEARLPKSTELSLHLGQPGVW